MSEPRNYPDLMMAAEEAEQEDIRNGHIPPETFGAGVAALMHKNLAAWSRAHVTVTDLDGNCPTCHGRGCADCINEDSGDDR